MMKLYLPSDWFILLFNLIGGIAIGSVLRGVLRQQVGCQSFFLLVWGALFGGIPLLFGAQEFERTPAILVMQLVVFGVAIAVTAFAPDYFLDVLTSPLVVQLILGTFCFLFGLVALGSALVDSRDVFTKLVAGGVFVVSGVAVLFHWFKLLTEKKSL